MFQAAFLSHWIILVNSTYFEWLIQPILNNDKFWI